ncbi:hypothetical protein [Synechococcus sp. BMK-MC-1]|uniref:hypothetical protein n=1 Tax=Synechococcus sp. BMK-MC-1 TaxID=1442551 RepID=UPI0016455040|nr:hypothetical protein [Synechococcus sp. BMK-MC-1]QNI66342.1 putative conserved membrane protein [Synechococcus sp. BMK-MC-1]
MKRWLPLLVPLVCAAFAFRALGLIDATGLWTDELYTTGKSFQPSYPALLQMLSRDTHPPLYYSLLWLWGQWLTPSALTLRLFSWLMYVAGGVVITAQAGRLSPGRPRLAMGVAALLAFCSPYPVRFAIEGKGYALLVLLVALAWWWRQRQQALLYGLAVALAACTHFYGLFLFAVTSLWDASRRRWPLAGVGAGALVPSLLWIVVASAYLLRSGTGAWIGTPDFALLEDTLARGLGLWPLPKLGVLLLVLAAIQRWGCWPTRRAAAGEWSAADRSGLIPSLLMVLAVVAVSFFKPLAFSRYFVVLLPALIPWLALRAAALPLNRIGQWLGGSALVLLLLSWWWHSFADLDPALSGQVARESNQFQLLSRQLQAEPHRYSRRARLFNLSDRMETAAGRMDPPPVPWGDGDALQRALISRPAPSQLWLADSGSARASRPRLNRLQQQAEAAGYRCEAVDLEAPYAQLRRCAPVGVSGTSGLPSASAAPDPRLETAAPRP